MTGLMTQDKGLAYVSDAISQAQLRLYKTYAKAPRRTALVIAFSLLKALVVLGWLVTRQKAGVFSFAPAQASQFEAQLKPNTSAALPTLHAQSSSGLRDLFVQSKAAAHSLPEAVDLYVQRAKYIQNELLWRDTAGNVIQAHGGSILYYNDIYYFYGENKGGRTLQPGTGKPPSIVHRVDVIGISCYSSTDLINWKNEGLALPAGQHPDLDPSKVVERPRVLYNDATQRFVMWMHIDTADYELASCGMATSASPTGPFTYMRSFRPHRHMCRDFTIFKDDDGTALIAYSSERNKVMHVSRLTRDFTDVELGFARTMVGLSREAPAMFKHGDIYLMVTSGCTGWLANRAEVFYARDPLGNWESLGNPCVSRSVMLRETTFHSQASHVLPIPGQPGRFIFMADRWFPQALGMSRYIWLPMWVVDIPQGEEDFPSRKVVRPEDRARMRQRFRSMRPGPASLKDLPPIDVVVRWQQRWNLSALDAPPPLCKDMRPGTLVPDSECAL